MPHLPSLIFVLCCGLAFGSFVTLAAWRIPQGEDVIRKRSRCPACGHALGIAALFPVISWLVLRAKCLYCRQPISAYYPLVELAQALAFVGIYLKFGLSLHFVLLAALSVCLLIMILIDFRHKIIPDALQIVMAVIGVAYVWETGDSPLHLLAGPLAGVLFGLSLRWFFQQWKQQEALGLGDVKFLGVAGLFLDVEMSVVFLLLSGLIGIATALLWRMLGKGREFPFGPALALALFFCLLFPELNGSLRQGILTLW